MKKQPLLSIIIPVYNSSRFIADCLDSCLSQGISLDNYEIICINDGSTDNSSDIINDYVSRYKNIISVEVENGGVGKARNTGIGIASGDYLWFVDSDDMIVENVLYDLRECLIRGKYDRIKVMSYRFTETLTDLEKKKSADRSLKANYPYKITQITRTILKRSFLSDHNIAFYDLLKYGEDAMFNYETGLYKPKDHTYKSVAYFYRFHENTATNITNINKRLNYIYSCKQAIEILKGYYYSGVSHVKTRKALCYWIETLMEQYRAVPGLTDQFRWENGVLDVSPADLKLKRLYNMCLRATENHDFRECSAYVEKKESRMNKKRQRVNKRRKLKGYILHPRKLLKKLFR